MKNLWRKIFSLCVLGYATVANASLPSTFESGEHVSLGNQVKIFFTSTDQGQEAYQFHLPNSLSLSYGDIVSFGDFYGTPNQPISQGSTEAERQTRFLVAFNAFAQNPQALVEANQLIDIVHQEQEQINDVIARGEDIETAYKKIAGVTSRKVNCATGGGCGANWWLTPGRYLELAKTDYDHFNDQAWIAYQVGHDLALKLAVLAGQTHDLAQLELAYAMNAFACHFLSDRFASGHIRTPRMTLPEKVTPSVIGSVLASYMHNEENSLGFHVHNLRGDKWIAYGDRTYFTVKGDANRIHLQEAMQKSAEQIFIAYQQGVLLSANDVYMLIPIPDEVDNGSKQDISPLFYWDNVTHQLMRREDIANVYDKHWTSSWYGWTTLIEIEHQRGLPITDQVMLAISPVAKIAFEKGLIKDL